MKVYINGKRKKGVMLFMLSAIIPKGDELRECHPRQYSFASHKNKFYLQCLSITHKKWIATDGTFYYIAELVDKKTGEKLPKDFLKKEK